MNLISRSQVPVIALSMVGRVKGSHGYRKCKTGTPRVAAPQSSFSQQLQHGSSLAMGQRSPPIMLGMTTLLITVARKEGTSPAPYSRELPNPAILNPKARY